MIASGWPAARALQRDQFLRGLVLAAAALVVALGTVALLWLGRPLLALLCTGGLAGLLVLARWPVAGLYTLTGSALLIDQYRVIDLEGYMGARLPSGYLPFWQTFGGVTMADAIVVISLALLVVQRLHRGAAPLVAGPLLAPVGLFSVAVLFGVWRGITLVDLVSPAPFSARAAVAEARALLYLPLLYLLAVTVLDTRARVHGLLWVMIAATGLKALQTLWVVSRLGAGVFDINEVATHEDSIYIGALVVLALVAAVYRLPVTMRHALLALLPVVAVALVANHRRISFIALGAALAVAGLMLLADRGLRRSVVLAVAVVGLALTVYAATFWHTSPAKNPAAWPVYAVRSVTDPRTERDVNSNLFRVMENVNLARTVDRAPWLGSGFGRQYLRWIEQPLLDASFTYWRYISHNSIYWVWVKLGAVGFVLFWYAIGGALALGASTFRRLHHPELKAVALVACAFIVMQMLYSYADLGLTSARNMVLLGSWMGVIAALSQPAIDGKAGA